MILDGPPDCGRKPSSADDEVPISHYRGVVRARGMSALRRELATHPLLSLRTSDPRVREILSAMIMRYPGNDLMEPIVTPAAAAGSALIGSANMPVLVITGDQDLASRTQAANDLAGQLRNAERAVIQASGHLPNLDNPTDYNAVVRRFLEQHAVPLR